MLDETWTSRELPVLEYLVQRFEDPDVPDIQATEIVKSLDLPPAEVARSLRKLSEASPPYVEVIPPAAEVRDPDMVFNVTERARRAVGQWPTAESVAELVRSPECGAVTVFLGTARRMSQGREVEYLEYEAYPQMALRKLQQRCPHRDRRRGTGREALRAGVPRVRR